MASLQKTLGKGGGSGTKHYFCHCSEIQRDNRTKPNVRKCARCIRRGKKCYHYDVADEEQLEKKKNMMEELCEEYPYLADLESLEQKNCY